MNTINFTSNQILDFLYLLGNNKDLVFSLYDSVFGVPIDKAGAKIFIKKKNRGKFTKSAHNTGESVQEHAHNVLNNPNASKLLKKRALFAINAKKWNH